MSKLSRRKFLGSAVAVAGLAAAFDGNVLGQASVFGGGVAPADSLSRLGWDSFLPYVNTDFAFYSPASRRRSTLLRLVEMTDSRPVRSRSRKAGQENFVLKFTSAKELPFEDRTYSVNHFNLGDFDMFVTFAGRDGERSVYTAVINRVTVSEG